MTIERFAALPFPRYPLNNVTPFTYRDGHTYLELLEKIREYVNNNADVFNENMEIINSNLQAIEDWANQTLADVELSVTEMEVLVDAANAAVVNVNNIFEELQTNGPVVSVNGKHGIVSFTQPLNLVDDAGAINDGTVSASPMFNDAISTGRKTFYVPHGTYLLTETLVIPDGSVWDFGGSTLIPSGDFDVIKMGRGAKISGGSVNCESVNPYTSTAILFSGMYGGGTHHSVTGFTLRGPGYENAPGSAAMKFECPTPGQYIDWVQATEIYMTGFDKLIWIDNSVTNTWINGNSFQDIMVGNSLNAIYVDRNGGAGADGNFFQITGQGATGGERVVYCSGAHNSFDMMVFDVGNPGLVPVIAELTPTSEYNTVATHTSPSRIIDNGEENVVSSRNYGNTQIVALEPVAPFSQAGNSTIPRGTKLVGNQDDWLANIHRRGHSITQVNGNPPATSVIENIFNPNPSTGPTWNMLPNDSLTFEIDFPSNDRFVSPRMIGLVFEYGYRPQTIEIIATDTSDNERTVIATEDNSRDIVTIPAVGMGGTWKKISVRLARPQHASGNVKLVRMWGVSGSSLGNVWLPVTGGTVYGDITTGVAGIRIGSSAAGQRLGFFGASPVEKRTGVAVTVEAIHEALESLGLISE